MLGVKKGQKVWLESSAYREKGRVLTVDKVGRRWITFVEDTHIHVDRDSDVAYERKTGDTYRRGKIWVSEEEACAAKALFAQWLNFCSTLGSAKYKPPRGMTLERLVEARKILGMEQDLTKTERETLDGDK